MPKDKSNKTNKDDKASKKAEQSKETIRNKAAKARSEESKPKRQLRDKTNTIKKPFKKIWAFLTKSYHLPISEGKTETFWHKKRSIIPKYFRESWQQLKLVTWPDAKQTYKLTVAVFIFAAIIAGFVALLDFILTRLFREVLLG